MKKLTLIKGGCLNSPVSLETKRISATTIVVFTLVATFLMAAVLPVLLGMSYTYPFSNERTERLLLAFLITSFMWFVLALFWRVPPKFASLPAISILLIGYSTATVVAH